MFDINDRALIISVHMATDWSKIYLRYKGQWVGFKDDEKTVIASGKSVKEVVEKSEAKGYPHPILFKVPEKIRPYVGGIC